MKALFISELQFDRTLRYFIIEAHIDYFNDYQVSLRFVALRIALFNCIDRLN